MIIINTKCLISAGSKEKIYALSCLLQAIKATYLRPLGALEVGGGKGRVVPCIGVNLIVM